MLHMHRERVLGLLGIFSSLLLDFSYCLYSEEATATPTSTTRENPFLMVPTPKEKCGVIGMSVVGHICEMLFFLELKAKPDVLCPSVYEKLQECVNAKARECYGKTLSGARSKQQMQIRHVLQARYCNHGSLSTMKFRPVNYCNTKYDNIIDGCYKNYQRTFRRNASDETLCAKYEEAKSCAKTAEESLCNYEFDILRRIQNYNVDRCWNPFCVPNISDFREQILNRGMNFSYVTKMIRRKLRTLSRQEHVKGLDMELLGQGVPKNCSYNSAALISTAISMTIDELKEGVSDQPSQTVSNSKGVREVSENQKAQNEKQKRAPSGNNAKFILGNYLLEFMAIILIMNI